MKVGVEVGGAKKVGPVVGRYVGDDELESGD